ncbi:MAG: S1 RNA-binding domain-containing protein [Patescibacteria group bacterium]|nr:S1 RNA-binding domain-containing protein [Patescibacteria group bacterium]
MMITTTENKNLAMSQLIKSNPNLVSFLKEGDLIEAKLLNRTPKAVFFDLEKFGTGVVYGIELINAKEIVKGLNMGDTVSAKINQLENEDGFVELSLANAHAQKNWQDLKDLKESGEVIATKIKGANSGGLIADISEIKAFLPVSQLSAEHYPRIEKGDQSKILEELKKFVGQELKVKIIDINPRNNKLIISEKEAVEENVRDLLVKYKVGDVIEGVVSGIADFGAFVRFIDNPSIEGLVHISEFDYKLIDSPKDVVKVDETVKVKIIEIKDDKVFLSLKALRPNPWEAVNEKFKEGQEVDGVVYKTNPFGAYISLGDDLYGLIHVSEFGSPEEMKKQLEIGKSYNFIIEAIKPEEKRIILKIKKQEEDENKEKTSQGVF